MANDTIEAQIGRLNEGVREIRAAVEALTDDTFLGPLGNWTPRDVVAHLIGWNRYYVRGARQLLEGELPFYHVEPGEDYGNVNARIVAEYRSESRSALLTEHESAASELADFLTQLTERQWSTSTGVMLDSEELTIRKEVDWLIEDHHHHSQQLRDLAADTDPA